MRRRREEKREGRQGEIYWKKKKFMFSLAEKSISPVILLVQFLVSAKI